MKEARVELQEKAEALTAQEKLLEERTMQLLTDAVKERAKILDSQNQIIERSWSVLEKVQITHQTPIQNYEVQEMATTVLIKQLKKEKEAMEDKVKMGINCIWMIVSAWKDQIK